MTEPPTNPGIPPEEELELNKPLVIFGRDVSKIPCFRSSVLYGAGGAVAAGLAVFMATSKPRLACNAAVGSFVCVNLVYWIQCRHRYALQKFNMGQIQSAYQRAIILDGTEHGKKLQQQVEVVDV